MKEIEVKAKIKDFDNLRAKLAEIKCDLIGHFTQEDIIFLPEGVEFPDIKKGMAVVRVRNSNGIITLTLKKRITAENELIKLEKEIVVNDKQAAIDIVEHMGYHEVVRVNKERVEGKYDGMTICIDDVEQLGHFIEVEQLSEDDNDAEIQESLFDFLQSLGVSKEDRIIKGYDTLMHEKISSARL